jgi:two-component system cell cycle sensor histidine kinase/response regulator CckA
MNLLTNASDALNGRPGRIDVRCAAVQDVDGRWDAGQGVPVRPGNWVLIEVRDTGDGMNEATRGRIFEPFFSTKEKGHGLGLAACVGIVRSHDGAILVESEPGKGSCFSVLLPRTRMDGEIPRDTAPSPKADHACGVLVIDDEALVRSHVSRALMLRGYTVYEADSGIAGIAAIETEKPDVVVLDMTMPDLDGADVVRRVRATGSPVPIVISSGYLNADVEGRLEPSDFQAFLSKPYSVAELIDAIERARTSGR